MEKPKSRLEQVTRNQELDTDIEEEKRKRIARILWLVEEINKSGEELPFPGIHPEAYSKMKKTDSEYPGYVTPIDELIKRCEEEGIKVVLGEHAESGNVYVLPADSDDIMDSIAPHQLKIGAVTNRHLAELMQLTTR